ncbi:LANO_0D00386g1_1 [Lachancea nothofagi CBS 11611]|uniref:LANO_0D00386g1_1 n=1 Tax=Lachancea nothofagi CBS 11611 TaxID=1266666 RepID=A0A1G4JD97_9SACH|nr:LANO_0D00386g1_1 [Lachancea nothofagi CBS 11611]
MQAKGVEEHLIGESHASDEDLRLPRDIFRSRLQYEMVRHWVVLISLGLELAVIVFFIHLGLQADRRGDKIGLSFFAVFLGSIVMVSTGFITYYVVRGKGTSLTNKLAFMKEIAMVKPGTEMREWDIIAAKMNPVFYCSSSLVTPYFFYDGESCYSYFASDYLQPFLDKKSFQGTNNTANDTTNNTANLTLVPSVDVTQPFIELAVKAYEEKAKEDWQRIVNGCSSLEN